MPLPAKPVRFSYIDKDQEVKTDAIVRTRGTGYKPTTEYHPTMRLVKCSKCGTVGVCEFEGSFNLKAGDRIMNGKPISGTCMKCNKVVELVPLPTNETQQSALRLYYQVQESLNEAVRRGEKLGPTSMVWPLERIREWEKWKNGQAADE